MTRVLFVDDDMCRLDVARRFFAKYFDEDPKDVHLVHVPFMPRLHELRSIMDRGAFSAMSLDNDLGPDTPDVITSMRGEFDKDPEHYLDFFRHRRVFVHSMNPVAAVRLLDLLEDLKARVSRVPFTLMREMTPKETP